MTDHVLLADISKPALVRLAIAEAGSRPVLFAEYSINSLENLEDAFREFMAMQDHPDLMAAAISASGWEDNGVFSMPNHSFRLERDRMRQVLGVQRLHMVNDCVSCAMAIPRLRSDELIKICGGEGDESQAKGLIAAGAAGLGSALLVQDDMYRWMALSCEGGHSDLGASNSREAAVIELMRQDFDHVSRERAVSTSGLGEVWRCLTRLNGSDATALSAEEVIALACSEDNVALEAVALCQGWLAAMASDASLMLGARGGIYLTGSLVTLMGDLFDAEAFSRRFCDKGRLTHYLQDIPVYRVIAEYPEIIGLVTLFD